MSIINFRPLSWSHNVEGKCKLQNSVTSLYIIYITKVYTAIQELLFTKYYCHTWIFVIT